MDQHTDYQAFPLQVIDCSRTCVLQCCANVTFSSDSGAQLVCHNYELVKRCSATCQWPSRSQKRCSHALPCPSSPFLLALLHAFARAEASCRRASMIHA